MSTVDSLFQLWTRPIPTDDAAATAAFAEVYTDPVRINGADMSVADLVARARSIQAALDDIDIELVDQVATADKLAIAFRQTGRHVGPLPTPLGPVSPTGRRIEGLGMDILTLSGGRISQIWVLADELQRLVQLDAVILARQ
jgi:hypothetical protein